MGRPTLRSALPMQRIGENVAPGRAPRIQGSLRAGLDELAFGVIGFGKEADATVQRYNAFEQKGSGLERHRVVGLPLFSVVAQCMNNYLVAQRFDDAVAAGQALDTTLNFTFTLRMKPTPVVLRLLSSPASPLQYVAIQRGS